ncbi:hypothetical protein BDW69DRAFT_188086 [Aspergillus filifer]
MPRNRTISFTDSESSQESSRAAPNAHPSHANFRRPSRTLYRHRQPRAKVKDSHVRQRDGDASQSAADETKDYPTDRETSTERPLIGNRAIERDYDLVIDVRLLERNDRRQDEALYHHEARTERLEEKLERLEGHGSAHFQQDNEVRELKKKVKRLQKRLGERTTQSSGDSSGEDRDETESKAERIERDIHAKVKKELGYSVAQIPRILARKDKEIQDLLAEKEARAAGRKDKGAEYG